MENTIAQEFGDSAPQIPNLLAAIDKIVKISSQEKGLGEAFFNKAGPYVSYAAQKLSLTPIQAVLFSHFLNKCNHQSIQMDDIAKSVKCGNIQLIQYMNDFDELEKKKLICCRRDARTVSYRVPLEVINAIRKHEEFKPAIYRNISIDELFAAIETLFEERNDNELTFEGLTAELRSLITDNPHLQFSRMIKSYQLDDDDLVLLVYFCLLFVNNGDDSIGFYDFEDIYEHRSMFRQIKRMLKDGDHTLMEKGLVENTYDNGFGDRESFKLTDKTKDELLAELNINHRQGQRKKGLVSFGAIPAKKLFYNEAERDKILRLTDLLREENFGEVQKRLTGNGMRTGFACLFSGPPGTGKTETVYQLARETGRDIMRVDLSETKSCWFGESEKRIKEIFTRYRSYTEACPSAPILLFNEADGIIGKRREFNDTSRAVDQTENTIQNIILEEMERLTGILIATTNLTRNMDKAFERRFLYKIEFEKPSLAVRGSIWQAMIPALSGAEAQELASRFDFSGGQIENIVRKRMVENVISGADPSLDRLLAFCREELMVKDESGRRIGFSV
jgi:hypothetical protein